jgi:hypothetical protein
MAVSDLDRAGFGPACERGELRPPYSAVAIPLDSFVASVRTNLMDCVMPLATFNVALNLVKHLYKLDRQLGHAGVERAALAEAWRWLEAGLGPEDFGSVVAVSMSFLAPGLDRPEVAAARVTQALKAMNAQPAEVAGSSEQNREGECMELDEVRGQREEGRRQNEEGGEGKGQRPEANSQNEEQAVALRASEVAERVAEFLSARLEDPASAEGIARDVAAAVVAGKRPATVAQRRKPLAAPRPKPTLASDASQQSLGMKFSLRFATESLRKALSPHQDVVRFVVAGRLCARKTFDELAAEYGLSRAEVEDIMSKMRAWVRKYTTYFDDDWYWQGGTSRYFIPEPPR